jgi:hypothetical protein
MRSFEARGDTWVTDEPLYAHYLKETGLPHPMAQEIMAAGETAWRQATLAMTSDPAGGYRVHYQKHMAHHLLGHIGRDWLGSLSHAFLIRDPAQMLASLDAKQPHPSLEDTGLPQQVELFLALEKESGKAPPVVDAGDLLEDPRGRLTLLCEGLGLEFTPKMLTWPPGSRESDGVWASHWYANVEASSGFGPPKTQAAPLPAHLEELCSQCQPLYETLARACV